MISSKFPYNIVYVGPLTAEICWRVWLLNIADVRVWRAENWTRTDRPIYLQEATFFTLFI